jgi:hypothetical protein
MEELAASKTVSEMAKSWGGGEGEEGRRRGGRREMQNSSICYLFILPMSLLNYYSVWLHSKLNIQLFSLAPERNLECIYIYYSGSQPGPFCPSPKRTLAMSGDMFCGMRVGCPVRQGQSCCSTVCNAQDPPHRIIQLQTSTGLTLRNPD